MEKEMSNQDLLNKNFIDLSKRDLPDFKNMFEILESQKNKSLSNGNCVKHSEIFNEIL